ncbi:predicted protein [Naegleria gruberi]|uniref:Predicted protein n=1 Tax=Naegleria gruberi TaxID=5762 RepID=D2W3X3_NAEGR|nr:uncharacterized protein NAEGRDRAFT_76099 [Naegleria gruberi]EFC36269.1 predicted protein [Naegleria gruberi]|eukprot:XP_002669013.1 predicted protein [Naegleria gruberi strain NEG-M]
MPVLCIISIQQKKLTHHQRLRYGWRSFFFFLFQNYKVRTLTEEDEDGTQRHVYRIPDHSWSTETLNAVFQQVIGLTLLMDKCRNSNTRLLPFKLQEYYLENLFSEARGFYGNKRNLNYKEFIRVVSQLIEEQLSETCFQNTKPSKYNAIFDDTPLTISDLEVFDNFPSSKHIHFIITEEFEKTTTLYKKLDSEFKDISLIKLLSTCCNSFCGYSLWNEDYKFTKFSEIEKNQFYKIEKDTQLIFENEEICLEKKIRKTSSQTGAYFNLSADSEYEMKIHKDRYYPHHISESARIFSLPKFKISEHYARLNIEFDDIPPLPDNYVQTINIPKDVIDTVKSKIKTINVKQDSIPLRKDTDVVGNKNDQIVCPLCQKNYAVGKNLLNHLRTKHDCSTDKAKVVADCMVNSCYLTNALHQELKRKIRLEKFKLTPKEDEIMIESDSVEPSQNNNTQNITISVTSPKKVTKSNSKTQICKCGKGRKAVKASCKSCRQCCLNNGGCTTHQFKCNLIEPIEEYDVLILDFETTDLQTRAPTDCLQNGTKEMEAVKLIIDFLPKKSLILAHNAPFDKSVLHRAFNHWRINNSKITDGMKNSRLIFLDTIPILKKTLKLGKNQCKLGNIYQQLFKQSIENQHTAAADVFALKEILEHVFGKENVIRNIQNHFNLIKDLKKSFIMVDSNGKEMKDGSFDKIITRSK